MSRSIVIPQLIDTLPFYDALSWESFQAFCTDVLYRCVDSVDSREYLLKGSNQQGIDVYAIPHHEEKITVAQCKLMDYVGPQQVIDIIDTFLNGSLVGDTSEFILCTSADLARQRDEEQTIAQARQKLAQHNIRLVVWDKRGLSRELRTNTAPEVIHIVYRYFGEQVAHAFYGSLWESYIKKLQPVEKRRYPLPVDYISRSVIAYQEKIGNTSKDLWSPWDNEKNTLSALLEQNREKEGKKLVLLSTAGFGKTEELNFLAGYFSFPEKLMYPIVFRLRDYEGQPIEDILVSFHPEWRNIPDEQLLLVLDGIDEIGEHHAQVFINHLNAFVERHSEVNAVVSSRYNAYNIRGNDLRAFEIYLLNPLTYMDIDSYLQEKLGEQKEEFESLLEERYFTEYLQNPYYLTRLVRFYREDRDSFPKNKTGLFERILFERIERDEDRYRVPELKSKLFPVARQIAFCMTLSGKSALTDEELKTLVPDAETHKDLNLFGVFNRNATALGSWSFEHKNLQEYLCASTLAAREFFEVHRVVSFAYDSHKLFPRFLNTVSFLFELIDNNSSLFHDLFDWINTHEPELLVRFEKEQLSRQTRREIFIKIFLAYKQKEMSLRISPHLSNGELARFVEVDEAVIDFLGAELRSGLLPGLAYDALSIISQHKKPYLVEVKIKAVLFEVLRSPHCASFIKAKAIRTFEETTLTEQPVFEAILSSGINLEDFEIRRACISLLSAVDYAESYDAFILESIPVFEEGQKKTSLAGSNEMLKRLIFDFQQPQSLKRVLQFCICHKSCISIHNQYRKFQFQQSEVQKLLQKAEAVYQHHPSILRIVYRLFCRIKYITHYPEWIALFRHFFHNTCGLISIFRKFYRYDKRNRDLMALADEDACNFLIEEYRQGRLEDNQVLIYRSNLYYFNPDLYRTFYHQLNVASGNKFVIDDFEVDYKVLYKAQEQKNEQMLLDRNLFLEEAAAIFHIIKREGITYTELWDFHNSDLKKYTHSIVLEAIRENSIHLDNEVISKKEFFRRFNTVSRWEAYVVTSVENRLKGKGAAQVLPELREKAEQWCICQIEALNFEKAIRDIKPGNFTMDEKVEYLSRLFLLLKPELDDSLLLKLLLVDFETFLDYGTEEETIAALVVERIRDRDKLRQTVVSNIKKGKLAALVQGTHFKVAADLGYKECLSDLYRAITCRNKFRDHDRVRLTGYYTALGGELTDFEAFLSIPEEGHESMFAAWHWLLLRSLLSALSSKVTPMLLQILEREGSDDSRIQASELLIGAGHIEGLRYWFHYIQAHSELPFEHSWENLQSGIARMPVDEALDLLFAALEFGYLRTHNIKTHGSFSIEDMVFSSLTVVARQSHAHYQKIRDRLNQFSAQHAGASFVSSVSYVSERLTQRYYETQTPQIDMVNANLQYQQFTST